MTQKDPSLERYISDIGRIDRINEEEESELILLAKNGSVSARNRLIQSHLRFVLKVALHYRKSPLPVTDLINEGVLGLARAIESYEKDRIKFISYAVWWIRSFIVRAIEDKGAIIRIPANEHARFRKEKRNRNTPGATIPPDTNRHPAQPTYLEHGKPGAPDCIDRSPQAEEILADRSLENLVHSLIATLPDKEAFVLRNAFGINQQEADTLQSIGWDLGLSQERVRQIREKALDRLRRNEVLNEKSAQCRCLT